MKKKIIVRPLNLNKDLIKAGNAIKRSYTPTIPNTSKDQLKSILSRYNPKNFSQKVKLGKFFVAEDLVKKRIVGVVGLIENEVRSYAVEPLYQGQGIGRLLMSELEQVARSANLIKITTRSSPMAEPIYKKMGFVKIKKLYRPEFNSYNVLMEKTL